MAIFWVYIRHAIVHHFPKRQFQIEAVLHSIVPIWTSLSLWLPFSERSHLPEYDQSITNIIMFARGTLFRSRHYHKCVHYTPKLPSYGCLSSFSTQSQLNQSCQESFALYGDNIAVIQDEHKITYGELNGRINSVCHMFQNVYDLTRGDKIMFLSQIRMDDIAIFMACATLGIEFLPMNPLFTPKQLLNLAEQSNPSLIITEPQFHANIESIAPDIPRLVLTEEFDPNKWIAQSYLQHTIPTNTADNDAFHVVFTSGTTGTPKGCTYSHNTIYKGAQTFHSNFIGRSVPNKDCTLSLVPLFGAVSIVQRMSVLLEGSTIVYPNKHNAKNIEHIYDLCEHQHPSISRVTLFGRTLSDLYHLNKEFNHMECVLYTGDFVPFNTVAYVKKHLFPKYTKFIHGYGCSEAMFISQLDPDILDALIDNYENNKKVNVPAGTPVYDQILINIADDGEIVVKKKDDSAMIGYLNNPQMTKEIIDADGWLHTGDLGYIGEDGLLYVLGRKKDIIKLESGRFMVPMDMETILLAHDQVDEVAIVGYPNVLMDDSLSGEIPVAFVALVKDSQVDRELVRTELLELCHEAMGDQDYQIKEIFFVEQLPKTPNRKLAKGMLRDMIQDGQFVMSLCKY
eukprot:188275_1